MFSFSLDTSLTHLRSSPRVSSPGKLAQQSRQFGTKVQAIWENVCGTLYIYIYVCVWATDVFLVKVRFVTMWLSARSRMLRLATL